ncbi:MAG: hypothetical protein ACEQSK_09435 [Sphingomonadaceae bacterium]
MTPLPHDDVPLLRAEIAAAAARLVAEDGADYNMAKRKAARQILGDGQHKLSLLPDNAQIEAEVRLYQSLFHAASQPARLFRLRTLAIDVMTGLERFHPMLTGAVLNGTAGAHDDIHLQLFADSPKDVEIFLLNKNIQIDISETPHFKGPRHDPVETVSFLWQQEGVHCALYELDDLRGAVKARADGKLARADLAAVRALLISSTHQPPSTDSAP